MTTTIEVPADQLAQSEKEQKPTRRQFILWDRDLLKQSELMLNPHGTTILGVGPEKIYQVRFEGNYVILDAPIGLSLYNMAKDIDAIVTYIVNRQRTKKMLTRAVNRMQELIDEALA